MESFFWFKESNVDRSIKGSDQSVTGNIGCLFFGFADGEGAHPFHICRRTFRARLFSHASNINTRLAVLRLFACSDPTFNPLFEHTIPSELVFRRQRILRTRGSSQWRLCWQTILYVMAVEVDLYSQIDVANVQSLLCAEIGVGDGP